MSFYEKAKQSHSRLVRWLGSPKSKHISDELKEKLFEQSLRMIEQAKITDQVLEESKQLLANFNKDKE